MEEQTHQFWVLEPQALIYPGLGHFSNNVQGTNLLAVTLAVEQLVFLTAGPMLTQPWKR